LEYLWSDRRPLTLVFLAWRFLLVVVVFGVDRWRGAIWRLVRRVDRWLCPTHETTTGTLRLGGS
jgi:hypothetical protein